MPITREDVERTARLARLDLTEEQLERFGRDLARITAYVEQLNEVAADEKSSAPVLPLAKSVQALREDKPRSSLTTEEAVSGAPDTKDGLFRVPRVIEPLSGETAPSTGEQ